MATETPHPEIQPPEIQPPEIQLPDSLPIFPLTGILLLPGGHLPLHIFEPRYRRLIEDVLEGDSLMGLIQPLEADPDDNAPRSDDEISDDAWSTPELYQIGCAGEVESWKRIEDGRFLILVKGLRRFRVRRELALDPGGYRRVEVDYAGFEVDAAGVPEVDKAPLLNALKTFGRGHNISFELEKLGELPAGELLNGLAMALPFAPAEKQALLEAPDPEARHEVLIALMGMGVQLDPTAPPLTLN